MKKTELKHLIKEIISEDIFLKNRKSPEDKAKTLEQELELEYKPKFNVKIYEGDIILDKQSLPYFKKYSKIQKVTGGFYCVRLKLKSLLELPIPKEIDGDFWCQRNNLTTLEGAPEKVGERFSCTNNKLTSLRGVPEKVGGEFDCSYNKLTTLKGAPKYVGGEFWCSDNFTEFTEEDVRKVCDVRGGVYTQ